MNAIRKEKVFVAMSGGVDSSVAAALLKEAGFDVIGIYMNCWSLEHGDSLSVCTTTQDRRSAATAAAKLGIPFLVWDFEKEYRQMVFQYFLDEYAAGRTPNPDVMCNRYIKFGLFLEKALAQGADYIATGHYIRIQNSEFRIQNFEAEIRERNSESSYRLFKAIDANKDQSYFLYTLTQKQLQHCLFPIGEYAKPQVRELAKKFGLPNAERKDSQGLCFVGKIALPDVLSRFMSLKQGSIFDSQGRKLGVHIGLSVYTIGQRYGLGIGGTGPYYAAQKDYQKNALIVAKEGEVILYTKQIEVRDVSWVDGVEPELPIRVMVKVRYRQPDVPCTLISTNSGTNKHESTNLRLSFDEPQRAVAVGQAAVFYREKEMIGGGTITEITNDKLSRFSPRFGIKEIGIPTSLSISKEKSGQITNKIQITNSKQAIIA